MSWLLIPFFVFEKSPGNPGNNLPYAFRQILLGLGLILRLKAKVIHAADLL